MQRARIPIFVAIVLLVLSALAGAVVYAAPAAQEATVTPIEEEEQEEATPTPEEEEEATPTPEEEEEVTPTPEEEEEATPTPEEEEVEVTPTPEEEEAEATPTAEPEVEAPELIVQEQITPTDVITGSVLPLELTGVDLDVEGNRTLTVVGTGEVSTIPDVATVMIGVETVAPEIQEALEENNERIQDILDVIEELGVPLENVQTANFNIFVERPGEPPPIPEAQAQAEEEVRFRVSQQLSVRVEDVTEDLSLVSQLIGQAVEAGANNVFGPNFQVGDNPALQQLAFRRAVENAVEQAQDLATLTGVELAGIVSVSEVIQGAGPGPVLAEAAQADGLGGGPPLQPGTVSLTQQVQIVFLLQ